MDDAKRESARRYSLKPRRRIGPLGTLVAIFAIPVVIHLCWRFYEWRRFVVAVDAVHARGEPILLEDFNTPPVADAADPVPLWREASDAVVEGTWRRFGVSEIQLPLTECEAEMFRQTVFENRVAIARARAAAGRAGVPEWGVRFHTPVFETLQRDLNEYRNVARMLAFAAIEAHSRGHDEDAVQLVRTLLAGQRAMYRYPTVTGHLVTVGSGCLAFYAIEGIVPELVICDSLSHDEAGARRASVEELIRELLDEEPQRHSVRLTYMQRRMEAVNDTTYLFSGDKDASIRWLGQYGWAPVGYRQGRVTLNVTSEMMELAWSPDWRTCVAGLERIERRNELEDVFLRQNEVAFWQRELVNEYLCRAAFRLAATALAIRMYALDHGGALPARLDNLVPTYLPAIPRDPLASNVPLHYRGGAEPVVYSFGENGVDDSGSDEVFDRDDPKYPLVEKDMVLRLQRQPRTVEPDHYVIEASMIRPFLYGIPLALPVRPAEGALRGK